MDFVKSANGTYIHDDEAFFPIDGKGWNDTRIGYLDQMGEMGEMGRPHFFWGFTKRQILFQATYNILQLLQPSNLKP